MADGELLHHQHLSREELQVLGESIAARVAEQHAAGAHTATTAAIGEAVDQALSGTFKLLGVDMTDQDQVNSFRRDLIFARETRRRCEKWGSAIISAGLLVLVGGVLAAVWEGIKHLGNTTTP